MSLSNRQKVTTVREDVEKSDHSHTAGRHAKCSIHLEEQSPQTSSGHRYQRQVVRGRK